MAKDYHKGYKLQLYISKELNEQLENCVSNTDISKSELVRIALKKLIRSNPKLQKIYNSNSWLYK